MRAIFFLALTYLLWSCSGNNDDGGAFQAGSNPVPAVFEFCSVDEEFQQQNPNIPETCFLIYPTFDASEADALCGRVISDYYNNNTDVIDLSQVEIPYVFSSESCLSGNP